MPPPFKECDISPSGKISITLSKAWFPHLGGDAGFICRLNLPLPASAAAQNVALCESAWSNDGVGKIRGSEPKLKNNAANYARKIGTRRSRLPAAIAAACAYFKEQGEKAVPFWIGRSRSEFVILRTKAKKSELAGQSELDEPKPRPRPPLKPRPVSNRPVFEEDCSAEAEGGEIDLDYP